MVTLATSLPELEKNRAAPSQTQKKSWKHLLICRVLCSLTRCIFLLDLIVPDVPYTICRYLGIMHLVKPVQQRPTTAFFFCNPGINWSQLKVQIIGRMNLPSDTRVPLSRFDCLLALAPCDPIFLSHKPNFVTSVPITCIYHAERSLDKAMNISDSIIQAAHVFIQHPHVSGI
jgi:hypothetical protein